MSRNDADISLPGGRRRIFERARPSLARTAVSRLSVPIFLKRFIRQTVYTRCTRMNYKIVPVTDSNRYVQYGASGKGVVEIQM